MIDTAVESCVSFKTRLHAPPGAVNVYMGADVGAIVCLFPLRQSMVVPVVLLTKVKWALLELKSTCFSSVPYSYGADADWVKVFPLTSRFPPSWGVVSPTTDSR